MPVVKPYQVGFQLANMFARKTDSDAWKPAVWHDQIRQDLINKAKGPKNESYVHQRESGTLANDITSFHADQKDWGEDRACRPKILFQFEAPPNWKAAKDEVGMMLHGDKIVLDPDNRPVRAFTEIPLTVSSKVEGWLMEVIRRQNHQITPNDFRARMPRDPSGKNQRDSAGKWTGQEKDSLCTSGGLDMRMTRWRMSHRCIAWTKKAGSDSFRNHLRNKMTAEQRKANSTEGMNDVTDKEELKQIQSFNLGKYMQRSRKRKTETPEETFDDGQDGEEPERKRSRVMDPRSDENLGEVLEPTAPMTKHSHEMDEMAKEYASEGLEPNQPMRKQNYYMDQKSQQVVDEELGQTSPTLKRGRNMEEEFEEVGGEDLDINPPARKRSRNVLRGTDQALDGGSKQRGTPTNRNRNGASSRLMGARSSLHKQYTGPLPSGTKNSGFPHSAYGAPSPRPNPGIQNHTETQIGGNPGGRMIVHTSELYIPDSRTKSYPIYSLQSNAPNLPFDYPLYSHVQNKFLSNGFGNLGNAVNSSGQQVGMVGTYPVHGTGHNGMASPFGLQHLSNLSTHFNVDTHTVPDTYSKPGVDFILGTHFNMGTHFNPDGDLNIEEGDIALDDRGQGTTVAEEEIALHLQGQNGPSVSATNDLTQFDAESFDLMFPPPSPIEPLLDGGSDNKHEICQQPRASEKEVAVNQELQYDETEDGNKEAVNEKSGMQSPFHEALNEFDEIVRPDTSGEEQNERQSLQGEIDEAITSAISIEPGKEARKAQEDQTEEEDDEFSYLANGLSGFEATHFEWATGDLEMTRMTTPVILSGLENEALEQSSEDQKIGSSVEEHQDFAPDASFPLPQEVNWDDPALVAFMDGIEFTDEDWASLNWDPTESRRT